MLLMDGESSGKNQKKIAIFNEEEEEEEVKEGQSSPLRVAALQGELNHDSHLQIITMQ